MVNRNIKGIMEHGLLIQSRLKLFVGRNFWQFYTYANPTIAVRSLIRWIITIRVNEFVTNCVTSWFLPFL